ncbi:hypothetical protein BGX21_002329 [Mortierella sp. AD011]|nr:hypothetical protein BGX21_002329 [Mortierella sp. AD011]
MIPTKRSSPFVRARSFQNSRVSSGQGTDGADGPSPSKRPSFARTMSSPFQVLSPSLKNTRNPFEKLSQPTSKGLPGSPNSSAALREDSEDEALDPNQTLKMFSLTQSATESLSEAADILRDSGDEGLYDELDQEPVPMTSLNLSDSASKDTLSLDSAKPRLRDALAMSAVSVTQVDAM